MKIIPYAVLCAFILCLSQSDAVAEIEDTIHESFSVHPGGTLVLESDLGSIEVLATESSEVTVDVIRKVKVGSRKAAEAILEEFEITFDQDGDNVNIIAKYPPRHERLFGFGSDKLQVHYVIHVPTEYNLDLQTSGGSITVDSLKGYVKAETSGGSLRFGKIDGPVLGKTSGGSITLEGCVGDADISTSGGSISIGDVTGNVDASTSGGSVKIDHVKGRVDASTSGGGIHVEEALGAVNAETSGGSIYARLGQQPEGDCRLTTSGGGVEVHLSSDIKVNLDAGTSGGHVNTDFDVTVTVRGSIDKSHLQGTINGGGPLLFLRSSGGSINIRKM